MTKKFSFLAKRLSVVRCFLATLFLLVLDSIKKRYTCNSGETSIRELNEWLMLCRGRQTFAGLAQLNNPPVCNRLRSSNVRSCSLFFLHCSGLNAVFNIEVLLNSESLLVNL